MRTLLFGILLMLAVAPVKANEFHVILNGKAIHLSKGNFNEKNYGLGFEYDFSPKNNWITFINGSAFKDSNNNTSNYLGGGMKRRFQLENNPKGWHADVGWIAFLMTRMDYKNDKPFPGILPVASIGKQWFALNATFIPSVSPKHKNLFFFQVMIRVAEF
ncbi:MAG: hypothetical protein GC149_00435 [Gammaproteobacteria bacterium]|nr:hypothetical protein [Gammaproteobacteria bacterium]